MIHVAGTKGKGSTCAYIECLLRQQAKTTGYPKKTGLYTSPHLVHVRERLRINFEPIGQELFAKYVSEVYELLDIPKLGTQAPKYLQFLTLVSMWAFEKEGVDVAIYEAHQGGEYDATSVIAMPAVTAITRVDRDHMHQLGPTISNVAWHKSGIFKPGVPAFSASQQPEVMSVLRRRADEKNVCLEVAEVTKDLREGQDAKSEIQLQNFSLALRCSNELLRQQSHLVLSLQDQMQAFWNASWPGRFQRIADGDVTWFLDCAHNEVSLEVCGAWFAKETSISDKSGPVRRILMFSHSSTHRDHVSLLEALARSLTSQHLAMDYAVFLPCSYITSASKDVQFPTLSLYEKHWSKWYSESVVARTFTPKAAFDAVRNLAHGQTHVLVTGNMHLVGDAIRILEESAYE